MTKYDVDVTRTFTLRTQITADTAQEAETMINRLLSAMHQDDFNPVSMDRASITPTYLSECVDCHNSEAFAEFPWCLPCARKKHTQHLLGYIRAANKRMKTTINRCASCGNTHYNCRYLEKKDGTLTIVCEDCAV